MAADSKKTRTRSTPGESVKPSDDPNLRRQIETRAFEIWLASGGGHGNDVFHWLQAESEVLVERKMNRSEPL